MSEWLDLMMDEVERKKQELEEARAESKRRRDADGFPADDQSDSDDDSAS